MFNFIYSDNLFGDTRYRVTVLESDGVKYNVVWFVNIGTQYAETFHYV